MTITAKDIREDIARSKALVQRGDLLRSLESMRNAAGLLAESQVFGREKFEIEALLDEALRFISSHKTLKKVLPRGLKYQRGKEAQLYRTVKKLHEKLAEAMERARVQRERARMAELDDLLIGAQDHLKEKDELEARKLFRRAAEKFRDVPGLLSDIGTRMMVGGLLQEAVEYLTRALEINARDSRAHSSLISCLEGLGEPVKAEDALKQAIKHLGKHEALMLRLAKLSLTTRNWAQAYELSKEVLDKNPLSAPAKKIMERSRGKVYRSPATQMADALAGKSKPAEQPSGAPAPGSGDRPKRAPIKLDM